MRDTICAQISSCRIIRRHPLPNKIPNSIFKKAGSIYQPMSDNSRGLQLSFQQCLLIWEICKIASCKILYTYDIKGRILWTTHTSISYNYVCLFVCLFVENSPCFASFISQWVKCELVKYWMGAAMSTKQPAIRRHGEGIEYTKWEEQAVRSPQSIWLDN